MVAQSVDVASEADSNSVGDWSDAGDERDDDEEGEGYEKRWIAQWEVAFLQPGDAQIALADVSDALQQWLRDIMEKLIVDEHCLIIALVLIERALHGKPLLLNPCTWRRTTLAAVAIACKSWYEGAVFNTDFSSLLDGCEVRQFNRMEALILSACDYNTHISLSVLAQYTFALRDTVRLPHTSRARRGTWSPGSQQHILEQCLPTQSALRALVKMRSWP